MVYATFPFADIWWDEEGEFIEFQLRDPAAGGEFRSGLDLGLDLLKARHANRWLADLRRLQPIAVDDQRWAIEDWFPRAIGGGLQHLAIVPPESAVAAMTVKRLMAHVDGFDVAYVADVDDARTWLGAIAHTSLTAA